MDLDNLEKMIDVVLKDLSNYKGIDISYDNTLRFEILNVLKISTGVLEEHQTYLTKLYNSIENIPDRGGDVFHDMFTPPSYLTSKAIYGLNHIKQIIEIERASAEKTRVEAF